MPDPINLTVQEEAPVTFTPEELRVINAVSPEATVEENAYGAEIVIKDLAHGTTRAQLYNGQNGISPTVTTEQIEGGAVITITDIDGTHTVTVYDGADGRGIANTVLNADYTLTITYTDGTSYTTPSIRGEDGKGIVGIVKTSTSGLVDTYTITYTDGTTGTLTVTNGLDGDNGVSPTVLIESITGGHRITITDAEHPQGQSIDVMDGQNGQDGRSIVSVEKTGTIGLVDTYTITYTSGGPTIFLVTNGADGAPGTPGTDGTNAYVWIRYASAQPTQDSDMSTAPGPWMGVYSGSSATAPEHYTDYTWNKVEGPQGGGTMILGPEEIQKLVADGKAKSIFNIGDVIYIPWTNYTPSTPVVYQFPFVVVHIGDVYDQNDVLHHDALWLMAMYAEPEEIVFDAAENTVVNLAEEPNALAGWYYWGLTGTDYTELKLETGDAIPTTYDSVHKCAINNLSVLRYGYNRWRDSAYRQWLNSDAAKNANWWTSQHEGDIAPTNTYTNKPGWLYGFENRWLDVIKPVKVQTACNTVTDGGVTDVTYDRFFLPSLEQMYGNPQAAGVEGEYWEYWKEETGLNVPSNGSSSDTNEARKIPSVVNYPRGIAVVCRLRSAFRGAGYGVFVMYAGGYLVNSYAHSATRSLPACVIY